MWLQLGGIKSDLLLTSILTLNTLQGLSRVVLTQSPWNTKAVESRSYSTVSYLLRSVSNHVCLNKLHLSYSKRSRSSYSSQVSLFTVLASAARDEKSPDPSPPRWGAWYTLFAHARNIPSFQGIHKIVYTYRTLVTYTSRVCSFHVNKGLQLRAICCLLRLYHAPFLL